MIRKKEIKTRKKIYIKIFVFLFLVTLMNCRTSKEDRNKTTCGNDSCTYGTVTDFEGNAYQWKKYGGQYWTTENLRSTKYSDGTKLEHLSSIEKWRALDRRSLKHAYSFFDRTKPNKSSVHNNEELPIPEYFNQETFGAYYTWAAASRLSTYDSIDVRIQGVCPAGWHLPSKSEWDQLELLLLEEIDGYTGGVDSSKFKNYGITLDKYFVNKNKLNSIENDSNNQKEPSTSKVRFEIVPSGFRSYDGNYYGLGAKASFWTATLDFSGYTGTPFPNSRIYQYNERRDRSFSTPSVGMCVRCVKN